MSLAATIKLQDACEFIVDCLHHTAPIQEEGFPSIRTPNIGKGRLLLNGVNRVSEETYAIWTQRAVPEAGDLILAREAPAGNVAIIKEGQKVCLGQRTVHLRPNKTVVDPDFLCYFLLAPIQQGKLLAGETGATAKHVNMADIRRLELSNLPDLQIQKKAGALIGAYDDLIENNSRRMALLEDSARQLYCEWFVRLRFPGHEHTPIVDGVPQGWERVRIDALGTVLTGKTPSTKDADNYGGDIPFIKTPDMHGNAFVLQAETYLSEKGAKLQENKFLPPGALLVSCIGTVGVVSITSELCQFNQQINAVIPVEDFLRYYSYFALKELKPRLDAIGGGVTMANVSKGKFESMDVLRPASTLLRSFDEFTSPVFNQIKTLGQQNQKLRQARDLLLPRLMSGELAV
jgi:type I restriction enzyme S subunit